MSTSSCADRATEALPQHLAVVAPGTFAGRSVFVVGGTSGIGAAVARSFAALGGRVTVTGATAAEVDAAVPLDGLSVRGLDVRRDAEVGNLVGALPGRDAVVNCAGVIRRGAELEPEVFAEVVDIDLTGTMRVCAAARPLLARRGAAAPSSTRPPC